MLTVPLILILLMFVFFILRILPGDLALALVGNRVTDAQLELVRHQYGLDLPLYRQFFNYFWDVLHGNLGIVITRDRTVLETILIALPNTLEIAFSGVFLGALIGIGMGVFVAKAKQFSKLGSFVV